MLAAVVFCQGCSWRCGYCHNPGLIPPQGEHEVRWESVLELLQRRHDLLDGVVFSGGEPTLQSDLDDAIREVRALGFKIGLHTGGIYPQRLEAILPLLDWVGMDVKAPFPDYTRITGAPGSGARAQDSLKLILASGVAHEIRTTVHPALLENEDVLTIAGDLAVRGVKHYVIQAFRSQGCQDEMLVQYKARERPLTALGWDMAGRFESFYVRTY